MEKKKLALLNTSILTSTGNYTIIDIDLEVARNIISEYGAQQLESAIGCESTAKIMSTLLGVEIPVKRQMFFQKIGQQALVFKLNECLEESKVLTLAEIERIGYQFQLMTRNK